MVSSYFISIPLSIKVLFIWVLCNRRPVRFGDQGWSWKFTDWSFNFIYWSWPGFILVIKFWLRVNKPHASAFSCITFRWSDERADGNLNWSTFPFWTYSNAFFIIISKYSVLTLKINLIGSLVFSWIESWFGPWIESWVGP